MKTTLSIKFKTEYFKFIDLFAGVGGFRIALQNEKGKCVFSSEWDKAAQKTYYENFGEIPYGDITKLTFSNRRIKRLIPDHDVLTAGFPCQPFSCAGVSARNSIGKKHGFECEKQGNLFFDIIKIAKVKRPKVLFLENVKNIKSHDDGNTFKIIEESIEAIGYDFKYKIINVVSLLPQKRIRCFMVCFRKDLNVNFDFPEIDGNPLALKTILQDNVSDKYTISNKLWSGHRKRTRRNIKKGNGFTAHLTDINKPANTLVARYGKDGKECLIPQKGNAPGFKDSLKILLYRMLKQ